MAYIALYRKYRSQSFGEVIGQRHVTTVLQNAIRLGRVAHAYLFCGPRGCGKTSTARLLARALNCQAGEGPTPDPCGLCDLCVRIRDGTAIDVIEMDAASETGIDDVREKIIENAKYAPAEARYKVYIIDEVHDLSLKAFDSLLKTLEEPPPHVVFVLATTEAHKVPITIRSRCQRMDFRRGTLADLTANIRRVLQAERIPYEPEAVAAIARAAEGSFRDSLSLLEQVLAYTDGQLTAEAVHAAIGTVGPEMLDEIIRTIASNDLCAAFEKAGELVDSGKDVKQILVTLQGHLRDLLIAGVVRNPQALSDVSPERFAQLREQAKWFPPSCLLQMIDILADAERDLRYTNQHRLLLETAFWKILPAHLTQAPVVVPVPKGVQKEKIAAPVAAPPVPAPASTGEMTVPPIREKAQLETTTAVSAPTAPPPPSRFAAEIDLEVIRRAWPRVVRRITQVSRSANGIFTEDVHVMALEGNTVVVGFPDEFKRSRVDKPKGHETLRQALAAELGVEGLKVRCVLSTPPTDPPVEADPPRLPEDPPPPAPANNGAPKSSSPIPEAATPPSSSASKGADPDEDFLELVMEELDGTLVEE